MCWLPCESMRRAGFGRSGCDSHQVTNVTVEHGNIFGEIVVGYAFHWIRHTAGRGIRMRKRSYCGHVILQDCWHMRGRRTQSSRSLRLSKENTH